MEDYKVKYDRILGKLKSARKKETIVNFFSSFFKAGSIILLAVLLVSLIELIARGDTIFRSVLALITLAAFFVSLSYYLMPSVLRAMGVKNLPRLDDLALRVGEKYPDVKDRLSNAVQVIREIENPGERGTIFSKDLAAAAFYDADELVKDKDFGAVVETKDLKKSALSFFGIGIVVLILFLAFQTGIGGSFYRIAKYNESFVPPPPFSLTIHPKDTTALRGTPAEIVVKAYGKKPPESVRLMLREKEQKGFDSYVLRLDSNNTYSYEIPSLRNTLIFYAETDWYARKVKTAKGVIEVIDKPFIRSLSGRIYYPSYAGLKSKNFDERSADITALIGSRVKMNVFSNKNLAGAKIVALLNKSRETLTELDSAKTDSSEAEEKTDVKDTVKTPLKIDGKKAFGTFRVTRSGEYYIELIDKDGEENESPIRYSIAALNDDNPSISLIEPVVNVEVDEQALLPIRAAISDDYGFTKLTLRYRLVRSRYAQSEKRYKTTKIPISKDELSQEATYIWDLEDIGISPDDIYEYYLEVFDNDVVNGPKSARTKPLLVKLPSLDQVLNQVDKEQDRVEKELKEALKKAEEAKRDMEELNRELLKKKSAKDIDWSDKKKVQDISKKMEDLKNKLKDTEKSIENITKSLEQRNAISEETLRKYQEVQKLLGEVNSPELEEIQRNTEEIMKKATPEQMQEAMENVKFNEEKFRKSLERTLKILNRLKAEQKADALSKKADELVKKQKELNEELKSANPKDEKKRQELAKKQEELKKDFEKMAEDFENFKKTTEQLKNMPEDEIQKASESLKKNETAGEMQKASQQCQQGDFSNANKSQKNAAKNMSAFAQQMQNLKKQMQDKGIKKAIRTMQKAVSDMVKLSKDQEDVKQKTKSMDYNSTQFRELMARQAAINQALSNSIKQLNELSEQSFAVTPQMANQLGNALRNMQKSIESLEDRNTSRGSNYQSKAMSNMNQAAIDMRLMLDRMKKNNSACPFGQGQGGQGSSGSGSQPMSSQQMSQQLQRLANQQQGINAALQKMAGGRGGLSQEERSKMSRIISEQNGLQGKVQEMAGQQEGLSTHKRGEKMGSGGDLKKLAEEMKRNIKELEGGRLKPETVKRQQKILNKLLDYSRSMYKRDKEKKRKAETGKDIIRKSPGDIDMTTQEGKARRLREILRSIEQGYSKDYEELIKKYFKVLESKEIEIVQ